MHYQTAYGWARQGTLAARKTPRLRGEHPRRARFGLAAATGASLVVLSSATSAAARLAREKAVTIRASLPGVRVLTGRPGDTLIRLRDLAQGVLLPR